MKGQGTSCTCAACVACCSHAPGWMAPEDARAALDAGRAGDLMLDWWVGFPSTLLLCPAVLGCEGSRAPTASELAGDFSWLFTGPPPSKGVCTFLKGGRCSIHDTAFKPVECRRTFACRHDGGDVDRDALRRLWLAPEARALVDRWASLTGFDLHAFIEEGEDHD